MRKPHILFPHILQEGIMLFIIVLMLFSTTANAQVDEKAIVKIFTTATACNAARPWSPDAPQEFTGTGSVITGNRILTNAHVIEYATYVTVKKGGDSKRYEAEVKYVSHQADLAILRVNDASFFKGVTPLEIGIRPKLRDDIMVVGYPLGGDELSYTSGIVSRIEVNSYAQSDFALLTLQVDAAINGGNSGGPAFHGDHVIGVAMMSLSQEVAESVGYLIPPEVINHFLTDVEDGQVDGYPWAGLYTETLENRMQRRAYDLDENDDRGILVRAVDYPESSEPVLRQGDIILSIDGVPLRANKKVKIGDELLSYTHLISMKQIGDNVTFEIIRDGKNQSIQWKAENIPGLVPYKYHETSYPYYLYGGFLFTQYIDDYLIAKEDWGQAHVDLYGLTGVTPVRKKDRKQIVFLHTTFQHEVSSEAPGAIQVIKAVDGKKVTDFAGFVATMEAADGWIDIEFDSGTHLKLDSEACKQAEAEIMKIYNIPKKMSM